MPSIPAIGQITDIAKIRIALIQDQQIISAPATALSDAVGLLAGGSTGQVLTKSSDTDYDTEWADIPTQGDFSGPASSVDGNLVAFDGTTGKLGKDSGTAAADLMPKSGGTFTGAVTLKGNSTSITGPGSGNVSIELGGLGYSNLAFIDFHTGATNVDYDARIIASGGTGVAGGGGITFTAGGLFWSGTPSASTELTNKAYVDGISTDLASTANAKGASLIGIEDSAGNFTSTDVEAALAELASDVSGISPDYGAGNAALAAGSVGTYAFARAASPGVGTRAWNSTVAGSNLKIVGMRNGAMTDANTPAGTWRVLGTLDSATACTVLRIS